MAQIKSHGMTTMSARRTGRFPQLGGAGHGGPRKAMKIVGIGQNAGSGEIEINHGAIEAEQLRDPSVRD